eukprot:6190044-Pleurochrysis_carterae.AAC.2
MQWCSECFSSSNRGMHIESELSFTIRYIATYIATAFSHVSVAICSLHIHLVPLLSNNAFKHHESRCDCSRHVLGDNNHAICGHLALEREENVKALHTKHRMLGVSPPGCASLATRGVARSGLRVSADFAHRAAAGAPLHRAAPARAARRGKAGSRSRRASG